MISIKNIILCFFLILLIPNLLVGQDKKYEVQKDTSKLKRIIPKDSILINNQIKSDQFYDSLFSVASKNKITKTAIDLIFINQNTKGKYIRTDNTRSEEYYKLYTGKIIRNIEIIKLDVFGPNLADTTKTAINWIEGVGNNTHIKTRDFILKNNLFFHSGDSIDPTLLVDNERLLRELDYIKDA